MVGPHWLAVGAAAVLAALCLACGGPQPSVLLISIESLRLDEVGRVVNGRPVAPALAAFSTEAVDYRRCYSSAPWTTPSLMSVMTGLPAPAHGVEEHDRALASSVPTLAERFAAAGRRTGAIVTAITLRPEHGFGRGFEIYDVRPRGHDVITSPEITARTLHLLDQWRDEPFFLWVHYWDPHYNYLPPPPWNAMFRQGVKPAREDVQCLKWVENPLTPEEAQHLRGQYDGEVCYTDRHVKDVLGRLQQLGRERDTIVVILGDHGEAFQEHGWLGHTVRVDEEMTLVPLMIRWPGRLPAATINQPVSLDQLGRTLLTAAGLPTAGFGLAPPLPLRPAEDTLQPASALVQTMRMGCYTGLASERYKYVVDHRTCRESLFDLAADPGERRDCAAEAPEVMTALRRELRSCLAAIRAAQIPRASLPPEIVREAEAALRSIGYVGGGQGGGAKDIVCAELPEPTKYARDSFGDLQVYQACPDGGAWLCLDRRD